MTYVLTILGHVPAKKNAWRPMRGRMAPLAQPAIEPLILQARAQWRRSPLARAAVRARFFVATRRGDLDNKLTTILDVLRAAGVLVDDNIGTVPTVSASAVLCPGAEEWCAVRVRRV